MFRRNTVFVVGAGASKELGLPVGAELADQILGLCDLKFDDWGRPANRGTSHILSALKSQSEDNAQTVSSWRLAMSDIAKALPFKDSIDAVIDQFYDRPEVAQIGKYMIASLILSAEARSALKSIDGPVDRPVFSQTQGTWLHSFARMLFERLRKDDLSALGTNVSIICFNYDRCIERYISHAIAEAYGCSLEEAIGFASKIKIVHAYGSLGPLPGWPGEGPSCQTVPFGGGNVSPWKVSENLQTFSESVDGDTDEAIKNIILNGEQYVYLGLSFGRQNMELLSIPSNSGTFSERDAFASGMGQSEQSRATLCRLIRRTYGNYPVKNRSEANLTKLELNTKAKELLDLHWHNILG